MLLFDRAIGRMLIFRSHWQLSPDLAAPSGGTVIDPQAREAIAAIIEALRTHGVLGTPAP
jgi:hypothetical protein